MPIRSAAILDGLIKTERHTKTIHHPRDTPDILRFLLFLYTLFLLECLQIGFEWVYGEWTYNVFPLIFLIGGGSILGLVLFVVGLTWFLRVIGAVPESSASHLSGMVNVLRDALTRPDNALLPPYTKQPEISPTELALEQRTRVGQLQALELVPPSRALWRNLAVGGRTVFLILTSTLPIFGFGIIHGMTLTAAQHMARLDSLISIDYIFTAFAGIFLVINLISLASLANPRLLVDSTGLWW